MDFKYKGVPFVPLFLRVYDTCDIILFYTSNENKVSGVLLRIWLTFKVIIFSNFISR